MRLLSYPPASGEGRRHSGGEGSVFVTNPLATDYRLLPTRPYFIALA